MRPSNPVEPGAAVVSSRRRRRGGLSRVLIALLVVLAAEMGYVLTHPGRFDLKNGVRYILRERATVAERLAEHGPAARGRWAPFFERVGVTYPPDRVALLAVKDERRLVVYADGGSGMRLIRECPVLGASGLLGPKLRRGDNQVPEGLYAIESLNPNSHFHLALRVGYPNAFDRRMGDVDKREDLGGDIMIHGGSASAGCLAMGDETAEDLFVLVADTGIESAHVIIAPVDFRHRSLPPFERPAWADVLYKDIARELRTLPE
jgi:hypothetical protein